MSAMNLSADYIYNRIGYEDIKRIYKYFSNNQVNRDCKNYLYYDDINENLDMGAKDHIWRNYMKTQRTTSVRVIVELMSELERPNNENQVFNMSSAMGIVEKGFYLEG